MFRNYRCHKCGNIIAIEQKDYPIHSLAGIMFSKKWHDCSEGLADDEKVVCDFISVSDSLLQNAYEVYYMDKESGRIDYSSYRKLV